MEEESLIQKNHYRRNQTTSKKDIQSFAVLFFFIPKNSDSAFAYSCIECDANFLFDDFYLNKTKNNK